MISEKEIITLHQTTKQFNVWYVKSVGMLKHYMEEEKAYKLVHYSIFEVVDESVVCRADHQKGSPADFEIMTDIYYHIFRALGVKNYTDIVREYMNTRGIVYYKFMHKYGVHHMLKKGKMGKYWNTLLKNFASSEARKKLLEDLMSFSIWNDAYVRSFVYQYLAPQHVDVEFDYSTYRNYSYSELKRLEQKLDNYTDGQDEKKVNYSTREAFLVDLVGKNIGYESAVQIDRKICNSKKLDVSIQQILHKMRITTQEDLSEIKHLKSLEEIYLDVFRVNDLMTCE